jgi:hypothetical protein
MSGTTFDNNGEPILRFAILRERFRSILIRKLPELAARIMVDRQWPVMTDAPPVLLIESGAERKTLAVSGGSPEYAVLGTIAVTIRVQARSQTAALELLDALEFAVGNALLCQPDSLVDLPGFADTPTINRTAAMSNDGDRIDAQVTLAFDCAWTEYYPPATPDDLRRLHIVLDAIDPFDPTGAYPPIEQFPAPAAPTRTSGPDGRAEVGLDIDLPL